MSMMPEDYENLDEYLKAVEEARKAGRTYSGLSSLSERSGTSEVKLSGDDTDNETLMLAKFGYSMPPAMITKMATKLWGYLRDGNISDELQQLAVKSTNALADQVLNAPCTNRQGRMEYEKDQAQFWENEAKALGGTEPDYKALLHKWSSAYAFCQQVRIISETKGIAVARPYFREYELMEQQMSDAEMDISRLPMAYNSMCWCHIRHFKIQKERAYAIANGLAYRGLHGIQEEGSQRRGHSRPYPHGPLAMEGILQSSAGQHDGRAGPQASASDVDCRPRA